MMTVWDSATSQLDANRFKQIEGVSSVRVSQDGYGRILTILAEPLTLDDVTTRFVQLKQAGNLRCRSLKLFFSGKMEESILLDKGLTKKGPLWMLPHNGISILAVPFGPSEWCFMIEKRTGHGVPIHALSFLPHHEHQMKWKEVEVS
jgi:hypothetical protein